ncbi:lamin tail domain-containing protein [Flaviramulus sp. BrNp1-15]|uniref:lamin tail domain-containing protein n=1 Tax=Flaviramulus sp. BrNp1-15 TaxID=2916754 RepID=UPI001EE8D8EC|nr:lamin tail domain-containing protein [Flaviramulus sp. BrNp1-15]ULC59571.1 lamin tail domain-containing protein [Flaviramulus sp. BrNp1-15]
MKKLSFLFLLVSLGGFSQNVTITKVIESDCSSPFVKTVELYVDGTVDFSTEVVMNYMLNGASWADNQIDISGFGVQSDKFLYIVRDIALMQAEFPSITFSASNTLVVATSTNGDDGYQIVLNGIIVSQFGKTETDADTDTIWEHDDSVVSRKSGVPDNGTWNETHWDYSGKNSLDGETACNGGSGIEAYLNGLGGTYPLGSGSGWTPTCGTALVDSSAVCDTTASGATDDTYTATLGFSGGNNGNTFTVNATDGTVGGDNPTSTVTGTITVTNIPEGTDITITVSDIADGGVCDLSRDIDSPGCIPLIINEVLFDPAGDITGDANGDGIRDALDDEFIELVNNSGSSLDISGYTISDAVALRHTFPALTIIPANSMLVVFGGGTPTGSFGSAIVQTASEGELNFSNGGDIVTVRNTLDDEVVVFNSSSAGVSLSDNQSVTRDPDITGSFSLHTDANASLLFSPGALASGAILSTNSFSENKLSIYPNPVTAGYVNIKSQTSEEKHISMFDLTGREVLNTQLSSNKLNVNSLKTGMYLLKILENNNILTTKLIIK